MRRPQQGEDREQAVLRDRVDHEAELLVVGHPAGDVDRHEQQRDRRVELEQPPQPPLLAGQRSVLGRRRHRATVQPIRCADGRRRSDARARPPRRDRVEPVRPAHRPHGHPAHRRRAARRPRRLGDAARRARVRARPHQPARPRARDVRTGRPRRPARRSTPTCSEFDYGEYEGDHHARDPRDAAGLEPVARRRARRRAAGGRRRPRRPRDRPCAGGGRRRRAVRPRTRAAGARRPLDRAARGRTAATSPWAPRRCPSSATSASAARCGCGTTPATCGDRRDGAPARRAGSRADHAEELLRAAGGPAGRRDARRRAHPGAGARLAEAMQGHWERHGFGYWMWRDKATGRAVGRGGLHHTHVGGRDEVEIGWAVLADRWGEGFATEIGPRLGARTPSSGWGSLDVVAYTLRRQRAPAARDGEARLRLRARRHARGAAARPCTG